MEDRIVFMGSPDFAVPILAKLSNNYNVVGVVTQPDRPAGRGRKMTPPPVKTIATELDLPVIQPKRLDGDYAAKKQLVAWYPEVIVVAAFGQILKKDVLELAPRGCINVHASLLPRWRGVSPIQAAILNGDEESGVTLMKMDEGIDTGDIISQRAVRIEPEDTGGSLYDKLAKLGSDLLLATLPGYLNGELQPIPQDDTSTLYAPMLRKSDGSLDFSKPAIFLARMVRAYSPWPGTFTHWKSKTLKVHSAHAVDAPSPGTGLYTIYGGFPTIGTSDGLFVIDEIQPAGKNRVSGDIFLRGARDWKNT